MEIEGIDRLVIGVKDMDGALGFFRNVFGVTFTEITGDAPKVAGCRVAISLDKRLELISPVAEPLQVTNPPDPRTLAKRLEDADAVLYAVIFKVKDLYEATANADRNGVRVVGNRVTFARDDQLGISNFDEVTLAEADTFGIKMALSQYDRD